MQLHNLQDTINRLKIWEVLDYYDGPKFYSCKDVTGQIYIVFWADENEGNDYWLYLKVSPKRYLALKNGILPIREVLEKPEEGVVYLVIKGNDIFDLKVLSSEQIDKSWLPEPDDYLELDTPTIPEKTTIATKSAKSYKHQTLDLAFVR